MGTPTKIGLRASKKAEEALTRWSTGGSAPRGHLDSTCAGDARRDGDAVREARCQGLAGVARVQNKSPLLPVSLTGIDIVAATVGNSSVSTEELGRQMLVGA